MDQFPVIPRIEDLPYYKSPPVEFVYTSTATLSAGSYTWADTQKPLTPDRPLMANTLYYFRSVTLTGDLDELDYTSNLTTTPKFQMYLRSRQKAILFREPVYMVKFLQNFDFRFAWFTQHTTDQLYASFTGVLTQGPALVGKGTITLTAVVSAQEVVDENFIKLFKSKYPDVGGQNG